GQGQTAGYPLADEERRGADDEAGEQDPAQPEVGAQDDPLGARSSDDYEELQREKRRHEPVEVALPRELHGVELVAPASIVRRRRSTSVRETRCVASVVSSRRLPIRGWPWRRSIASTTRPAASTQISSAYGFLPRL